MKIAIMVSPENEGTLVPLLKRFRGIGLDAFGLKMGDGWEDMADTKIEAYLTKATHYLLVCSAGAFASSWFPYAAGRADRADFRLALFRDQTSPPVPGYVRRHHVIESLDELEMFYKTAHEEWVQLEAQREAKAALLAMGISVRGDAFAECVREGDIHAVNLFVRAGFPADSRDKHGVPMVCLAARSRHKGVLEALLSAGADIDLQSEDRGFTALMDAVSNGSDDLIEFLVKSGANADLASKDGQTALVIAVGKSAVMPSRLLLEGGANPDIPDKLGFTARKYAKLFHNPEICALFDAIPPRA